MVKKRFDGWLIVSVLLLVLFIAVLIYPMFGVIKQAVIMPDGSFSWEQFHKFFSNSYYVDTIYNSFKITIFVTVLTLVIGIPFAYFYAFYRLKGAKILFVVSILCCMSAPFLGAYSWVMLLGRSGVITKFFKTALGITLPSIYGFGGIALSQTLKFFPLVFIYMNGAFKSIDNTLMEASANMGCTGVKRLFKIVLHLTMPTILAATLMVFMQAFADFGTPTILGEGFKTFPVLLYNEYLGENGANYNFAAALAIIAVIVTAVIFFLQKWATGRFKFSINTLHPVEKKDAKGLGGFLMHLYCYLLCAIIKGEAMGQDAKHLLSDSGRIPGLKLLELYNEEKRIMLPETLANAMEEAKATLARTANPQLADFVLDKAYFTELRAAVDKVDSPFLRGYAAILIDSANLRSAVRTLRMGKGQDFLREVLIPDGNVGAERVANATDKDSLAALYAHSALEKAAVLGGEALAGGSMTAFELACDNAVNDYLKGARLISYGCEVPVAYMAAVEGEITAIRMILTGRLAGVPSQTIRERLRDLYV